MTPPLLVDAVRLLAGVCDGAVRRDDGGFNKFDSDFGHKLALLEGRLWSYKQSLAAWGMVRKYRGQLARAGIEYDSIPQPVEDVQPEAPAPSLLVSYDREARQFILRFPFSERLNAAIRTIPACHWDKPRRGYVCPANTGAAEALCKFAEAHGFRWEAGAQEEAQAVVDGYRASLEASSATSADLRIEGLGGTPRPFQLAGVAYALRARRCFLADEMGLGKTIEALCTVQAAGAFPALVVCPASVKLNWVREASIWLPGRSVTWLEGAGGAGRFEVRPPGRDAVRIVGNQLTADVVVVNYDLLGRWFPELQVRRWRAVIYDESHYLKNSKAQRSLFCRSLALGHTLVEDPQSDKKFHRGPDGTPIDYRLLLSGTVILNRPEELLHPLQVLDRLKEFGGWSYFASHYCGAYKDRFGWNMSGGQNLQELNQKLRGCCYIRRRKVEVLAELPEKTWSIVPVELSNRTEYERAEADIIAWLREQAALEVAFLASVKDLPEAQRREAIRSHANAAAARALRAEHLVRIGKLKQLAARGKLEGAVDWITNFLESSEDQKLVAYAYHQDIQKALVEKFPRGTVRIFGEDSAVDREKAVAMFQSDPSARLMVASLRAGREGITLTAASNVAFLEQGWTPAEMRQAEDRLHRIGQRAAVTCYYLLAPGTIDEDIRELIESKRVVVDTTIEGETESQPEHKIIPELIERLLKKGGKK